MASSLSRCYSQCSLSSRSSLHYNIPFWYSSSRGAYEVVDHAHPRLTPKRKSVNEGQSCVCASSPPQPAIISLTCKDWDYSAHAQQECLRLNLGIVVSPNDNTPTTAAVCPRPGPLSPTPTPDSDTRKDLGASYFAPRNITVSYSAVVPAGQDPNTVFIGWTTPGFQYVASQFRSSSWKGTSPDSLQPHMRFGQHVEFLWRKKSLSASGHLSVHQPSKEPRSSVSTAYLVCLNDLLPRSLVSLPVSVR